jgi:hypothetical protein
MIPVTLLQGCIQFLLGKPSSSSRGLDNATGFGTIGTPPDGKLGFPDDLFTSLSLILMKYAILSRPIKYIDVGLQLIVNSPQESLKLAEIE